ncbi:MAG: hypothetical protein HF978_19925 [Desulfobacteraceae bacterium]|nr:lamin tail domain-containing protein [Desulfobacteraceae bacterium]MBC2757818.1 hypothetical protein [Desulfobacteraceae bacterium]
MGNRFRSIILGLITIFCWTVLLPAHVLAAFSDIRIDWDLFNPPTGYTVPYTFNGQPISDHEGSSDPTNGGAAVEPDSIDLASGSPNDTDPGPYDTPSFGYYNGGTDYDPEDPSTMEDDYIVFVMRLVADPSKADGFTQYHWNVLIDIDGDGYKEYWLDLFGGYTANSYDELRLLYNNENTQEIDDPIAARVAQFEANNDGTVSTSHTRVRAAVDTSGDYFLDMQVPITAFKDLLGNQVLFPDSPVGFIFSTSASNTDPLQKDFMADLDFLTLNDPITFGDLVEPNGDPILNFAYEDLSEADFYTVGDDIYLYLKDNIANSDPDAVQTVTATVTNPATGDDETVTLTETGPNTGIFSNRGGASKPVSSNPTDGWIPYVETTVISENESWTLTYNGTSWDVAGSVSGTQTATATADSLFTSDDGSISFTLYESKKGPTTGDTITFNSYAGDQLTSSSASGADDDGDFQVFSGDVITYSDTNPKGKTLDDTAVIIGPGEPFIQFTRSETTPADSYGLGKDDLYVTVYHDDSNTNFLVAETITVTLSGRDGQTLTLTETGPDTGIFINTTGLTTAVTDGTETTEDDVWEDVDLADVTAMFTYNTIDYSTTATLFFTDGGGRVYFTNGAGTYGVELYAADQPVWIKVVDENAVSGLCTITIGGVETVQVTVTSDTGDSEVITLYETFSGSGVFMNRINDLVTTAGSAVVTSASSTFATDGVTAGDVFAIATGPDVGMYTVSSVDSETQITLTENLSDSRNDIGFNAVPLVSSTYDSSYTANDKDLEALHEDGLTVSYDDCDDGDTITTNDIKTDDAIYNAPPIVINEVLFYPDPDVAIPGGTTTQREYIQLYNSSNSSVNVTGYSVTDSDGFSYTIPTFGGSDVGLAPGEKLYIVLVPDGTPAPDYDSTNGIYYFYATVTGYPATGPDELGDPAEADDLVTYGSAVVTSASSTFSTDGVQPGDPFVIATGPDAGTYTVSSVDSETQITLTETLSSSQTGIVFNPFDGGDQIMLYDASSQAVDFVSWSTTPDNTLDFNSDDSFAVASDMWPDNSYRDVDDITIGMIDEGEAIYRISDGVDTDKPADWTYGSSSLDISIIITVAVISEFNAFEDAGTAIVEWQTVSEIGTVGFYLYRQNGENGSYRLINEELLPSLPHAQQGGTYRYVDKTAIAGKTYTYKLVELDNKGDNYTYGPFTVTIGEAGNAYSLDTPVSYYYAQPNPVSADRQLRNESAKAAKREAKLLKKNRTNDWGKLVIAADGIYYVSDDEIASMLGISAKTASRLIKTRNLSMFHRDNEIAYLPDESNAGIYFYGEAPDSIYTNDNIYWIGQINNGSTMESIRYRPASQSSGYETFTRTIQKEVDGYPASALFDDPEADMWLWDWILSGYPGLTSRTFSVPSPGVDVRADSAVLAVNLIGGTDTNVAPDHHVEIRVNGTWVGEGYWDGTEEAEVILSFASSILNNGENTVEVTGILDTGAAYSIFYIDSISLTYQSFYRADENKLFCQADGNSVFTVAGFSSPDIFVFDVTDPTTLIFISTRSYQSLDGSFQADITPTSPDRSYFIVSLDAVDRVKEFYADNSAADLKSPYNRADYLVITPIELQNAAQRLADYRSRKGLSTMVVQLEDIMDQFNYGIFSPHAIRDFLAHAFHNWQQPPVYVVLAGSGSYDYKNNQGQGDCLMPPLMGNTPDGLFALDNLFVDVAGNDGVPEMAVGRIPALTSKEMDAYIDKVISFETEGSWKKRALMLADYSKTDDPFPTQSNRLAELFPSDYVLQKIYLSENSISEARTKVMSAINAELAIINYVGHGGLDRLSSSGMLMTSDASALTNNQAPFVMTALSCIVGRFGVSGFDSLSEVLVLKENGGAAAVWAAAGLSEDSQALILGEEFYQAIFDDNGTNTIGKAVVQALDGYSVRGDKLYMLNIYNLLGDPALVVR